MLGLGLSLVSIAVRQLLGFSPATLFGTSDQGVWYDPSDFKTLFQDSAGTTPVTALEQFVGLMLDKSKGLVLGPELVVNGTFDSGTTGWTGAGTTPAELTAVSDELVQTSTAIGNPSFNGAEQIITTVAGKWYTVTGFIRNGTSFDVRLRAVNSTYAGTVLAESAVVTSTVATKVRLTFLATSTDTSIYLRTTTTSPGQLSYFDNISVRELPGNHATQPTATSRPVVSARVNLLTATEDFSAAAWVKIGTTASPHNVLDPIGGSTASTITATSANGYFFFSSSTNPTNGTALNRFWVRRRSGTGDFRVRTSAGSFVDTPVSITSDWAQLSISCIPGGATQNCFVLRLDTMGDAVDIWHPELIQLNESSLPYQRVNTATDYDSTGFPTFLRCDGVDDGMVTNSIDFTATDKMTVVAGVRKISDAATGMVVEFSASTSANGGTFRFAAPVTSTASYNFSSRGSASLVDANASTASYAAPTTDVLSGIGDISGDQALLRVDGVQVASNTADQGAGNYGNYPLYLFRRGGSSLPFNGRFYGLTIVNKLLSTTELTQLETYTNGKTKAFA